MNQLMLFRTIYLRSIAEAWANPSFRSDLLTDAVAAMRNYFGFAWRWGSICSLTVFEDRRSLRWIHDRWVWSRNTGEGLTLNVPLSPPPGTSAAQQSRALADWYRQRSSLFSDDWGTPYGPDGPQQSAPPGAGQALPDVGTGSPAPDGGYMPSSEDFASFKVVLLAAIAKAWGDERFRQKLQIDATTALRDIRGYELPWDLGIYLCDDPAATWKSPDPGNPPDHHQSYWTNETPHALKLLLPAKLDQVDVTCEPVALAMYNAAGAEYPFSCCCAP
jgi:ribosomally synthesized peptide (two-chain TOMM family)